MFLVILVILINSTNSSSNEYYCLEGNQKESNDNSTFSQDGCFPRNWSNINIFQENKKHVFKQETSKQHIKHIVDMFGKIQSKGNVKDSLWNYRDASKYAQTLEKQDIKCFIRSKALSDLALLIPFIPVTELIGTLTTSNLKSMTKVLNAKYPFFSVEELSKALDIKKEYNVYTYRKGMTKKILSSSIELNPKESIAEYFKHKDLVVILNLDPNDMLNVIFKSITSINKVHLLVAYLTDADSAELWDQGKDFNNKLNQIKVDHLSILAAQNKKLLEPFIKLKNHFNNEIQEYLNENIPKKDNKNKSFPKDLNLNLAIKNLVEFKDTEVDAYESLIKRRGSMSFIIFGFTSFNEYLVKSLAKAFKCTRTIYTLEKEKKPVEKGECIISFNTQLENCRKYAFLPLDTIFICIEEASIYEAADTKTNKKHNEFWIRTDDESKVTVDHKRIFLDNINLKDSAVLDWIYNEIESLNFHQIDKYIREAGNNALYRYRSDLLMGKKPSKGSIEYLKSDFESIMAQDSKNKNIKNSVDLPFGYMEYNPNVDWDKDIGGNENLRKVMIDNIYAPFKEPEVYNTYGLSKSRNILMVGPPGCGKTMIVKAIATKTGLPILSATMSKMLTKYRNSAPVRIKEMFRYARQNAPLILFLDEAESILGDRKMNDGSAAGQSVQSALIQMLTELDGISSDSSKQIFVIAATNVPDRLDSAAVRPGRFDTIIYVGPPDEKSRLAMLQLAAKKYPFAAGLRLDGIARRTINFSAADMNSLIMTTSKIALKQVIAAGVDDKQIDTYFITEDHFEEALKTVVSSLSAETMRAYKHYERQAKK